MLHFNLNIKNRKGKFTKELKVFYLNFLWQKFHLLASYVYMKKITILRNNIKVGQILKSKRDMTFKLFFPWTAC